ncbi:MAG: excinuclease ABC subunit UvrA [Candidatus Aminicenantes bacterium]|nr:excinuclease ABC subunit UvrA [Candidatus Aminicenantes bacterium]
MLEKIRVRKAAQHNLKNIDVELPRRKIIVVTGPSGSGKSSLAFDTLYAEGQRRYIECLSAYARQFIEQMEKPEVESIEGLSPAISIDQKTVSLSPRSTVGTVTEIADFFRLLYAKTGEAHCPECGRPVRSQTPDEILSRLGEAFAGRKVKILAPVVRGRKGEHQRLFERLRKKGYLRARVDGRMRELDEPISLAKTKAHTAEVLVDELDVSPAAEPRLEEAVKRALDLSSGDLLTVTEDGVEAVFSQKLLCPFCRVGLAELEPRTFSFNSPYGACPRCHGLGYLTAADEWGGAELTDEVCPECRGRRLKKESLAVTVGGMNIFEMGELPVARLEGALSSLPASQDTEPVAARIIREILGRLRVMNDLGLSYLHLNRSAASLSGGEAQRLRLAAQVGSKLRGVLYVLDEPTIGLHHRDNGRLIGLLRRIRDEGNTVVVVEHDEQTIRAADYVLDLGPGAGEDGGFKVAEGDLARILSSPRSLTAEYLRGEREIPLPAERRKPTGWITIKRAAEHNLKGIDVRIPLGVMTAVTGVSGSGKSTLVQDILFRHLTNALHKTRRRVGAHSGILGVGQLDKVVSVDQKPIGRTPRSNPATYTGVFGPLRELFAGTPEARMRGYGPGRFSFNVAGGRCEECGGAGVKKVEMHFLPDVFVTCDRCGGKRYNRDTLAVTVKGRTIHDFLEMTLEEAYGLLKAHPVLKRKLGVLRRVGLGYVRLGQPAPTLSGGEAQRIKLARELGKMGTGRTLYLLDEPTTGLHFDDIRKLLEVLAALVKLGNTVIVIEHNLEVVKSCDHVIDMGPEAGEEGGWVVAEGTPEDVVLEDRSFTGRCLKKALARTATES